MGTRSRRPTGKYQIMWGKFMRYEEAQKVKLKQQNWSSHLPKNGYLLLRMKEEGRLVYTDTKQPGTLNLTEQQGKQQERRASATPWSTGAQASARAKVEEGREDPHPQSMEDILTGGDVQRRNI